MKILEKYKAVNPYCYTKNHETIKNCIHM